MPKLMRSQGPKEIIIPVASIECELAHSHTANFLVRANLDGWHVIQTRDTDERLHSFVAWVAAIQKQGKQLD